MSQCLVEDVEHSYLAEERFLQENIARAFVDGEEVGSIAEDGLFNAVSYAVAVFVSGVHCSYSGSCERRGEEGQKYVCEFVRM